MTTTATRLITLIMLLQNQPNQKAADLADKLGVSVRTLHRYLGMLDEMGIPVTSERGPYGGFALVRGYKMPPLVFTPEEAVAVALGAGLVGEMWGAFYQQAAQGALAKLDRLLPDEQRAEIAWARRALVATGLHRVDLNRIAPVLEKLRRAVRERRQVELLYHSSNRAEPDLRRVDAYALVHRWGWWYAVGYCHLRQALRSFRLDRIERAILTEQGFAVPADFDIRQYLEQEQRSQNLARLRLRFAPEWAYLALNNRAFWEQLEEKPDGSVEVTLTAPDLSWAASTALAYGPAVTVLEPDEARQLVQGWAREISALYQNQGE